MQGFPLVPCSQSAARVRVDADVTRVPITDVARWLGHKDIRETYATYSHFMPGAEDRALGVLATEFAEWAAGSSFIPIGLETPRESKE
jgi:hypothetical protein